MEDIIYKGFNGNEILLMFRFLNEYDRYSDYKTQKGVLAAFPSLAKWNQIISNGDYRSYRTIKNLNNSRPFQNNLFHLANNEGCLLLSFLCHFRNAIAHGHIEKNGDVIELYDKPKSKSQLLSACGKISADTFFRFIQLFI